MLFRAQLPKVTVTPRPVSYLHEISSSLASSAVTPYLAIRNYLEFVLPEADISCVVFNDSEGNVRLPRRLVSHVQEERT